MVDAVINRIEKFLNLQSSAGIVLMAAAALALIASNVPGLREIYASLLSTGMSIEVGDFEINKPLLLWINDGLMASFFFLIGLEIKREVMRGELSTRQQATLPLFAAVGGVAAPALIYAGFNWGNAATIDGWAIPAATDIAFALGVLSLLGPRAPMSWKILLLAIAIIDDLSAIVIIAIFYTSNLSLEALGLGLAGFAALYALNRARIMKVIPYVLIGTFVWVCVLKSGVHATLAGVVTGLMIPIDGREKDDPSPLETLEHDLHPWVAFLVLPVFAFANAGVSFAGMSAGALTGSVPLGVGLGLLIGKPLGVVGMAALALVIGAARMPEGMNWKSLFGVGCLTGIGFTMSLFIGSLAFDSPALMNEVRLGVLLGSIAAGLLGFFILRSVAPAGAESAGQKESAVSRSASSASCHK